MSTHNETADRVIRRVPVQGSPGIVAFFTLSHLSHHLCTALLIPLLPFIRDAFGLSYAQAGFLVAAFSLSYGFAGLPMGIIADWVSKRWLIAAGMLGIGLATFSIALSHEYYQLVIALIAMGLLGGSYHAPSSTLLSHYFQGAGRGSALGFHFVGGSLGHTSAPFLAALIAQAFTWRTAFGILALPVLFVGLIFRMIIRLETTTASATNLLRKDYWKAVVAGIRNVGLLVSITIVYHTVTTGLVAFLTLYLVDKHQMSPGLAASLLGLFYSAGMVAGPVGGFLSDRMGRGPVILSSAILAGPAILLVTVAPATWPVTAALVLFGLINQVRSPVTESYIADVVPIGQRAGVLGVYYFANSEVGGVFTPAVGGLIDWITITPAFTILAISACILSLSVLILSRRLVAVPVRAA
ncbi:MAG: MFS transporter [Chloroflexi bacterium]|nr:MFS transporter [Chloroflexota bacterium]